MPISDLFNRRRREEAEPEAPSAADIVLPTKALPKFLAALSSRTQPVLLDLGPVVGDNVTFFGEQLGCKIFVEDVYKDLERFTRDGKLEEFPAFLGKRFPQEENTFDGILCWDTFDYMEKAAGQALAAQMARILKPDGVLLAFFNASEPKPGPSVYTKHIVADTVTLKHRAYPATRGKLRPILNRDIVRMFEPLRVVEQFLLKTNQREVLFRK